MFFHKSVCRVNLNPFLYLISNCKGLSLIRNLIMVGLASDSVLPTCARAATRNKLKHELSLFCSLTVCKYICYQYLFRSPGIEGHESSLDDSHSPQGVPETSSQSKVNPYSVIDITPLHVQQLEQQQHGPSSSTSSPIERKEHEGEVQDIHTGSVGIKSGYSVPVPCGYATPSGVPLITPAYTTPVIIRHLSMDEDGKVEHLARRNSVLISRLWVMI